MSPRRILAMMTATAALIAGPVLTAEASTSPQTTFSQQTRAAGLTAAQAAQLQQRVDTVLATDAQARQVSANKLTIAGGDLVLRAPGQRETRDLAAPDAALACANGHLCIKDGTGSTYDYYYCGYYDFSGVGDGTFNNNQSSGTRARFYNQNGSERWSNVAKDTGTAAWSPVYHIRPC
ncbi:hypothetical protein [Streptomyces sp. NBC_00091]|uniref:hypothetical protein n=1 Tax=Streptomyces sp. NBC_00091 TaxID=2975648 RepID=UPI00224DC04B|nr:hypothetical protein [Streptomyces sp. NBC_00091]MCX5376714.1 hypothetical protein [Streptomyces sp. NBC_00091]